MIEKYKGEDLPGDVEQRDASVIITELPVSLPFVEMDDGRVFEIPRNLSLAREDLPGDVEQRDASVIITELPVPLLLVEMDDGRVFEILRNLSLASNLLEECCEFCHHPVSAVLVDFLWDGIGSRYFTTGILLHGPDKFWQGRWQIQVIVRVHLREPVNGSIRDG
ncbi:unnamed protein product [Schistocephalus solidus]|uniref:Velvet domain-containing protein n=1 Tax=Schistocephalus solidus TaxID=70667 RepID=A0A183TMW7_SCHSO|nr:unnamed protein product [Schistocephalus solidus]